MATCMIKNSGSYLRKISIIDNFIGNNYATFHDDSLNFIRIIYENCPLVEYLSLPVFPSSNNHFNEFEKLLKTCQKLRSLFFQNTMVDFNYQQIELKYAANLLNVLIRTISANLR